jgi:hypothetical protein
MTRLIGIVIVLGGLLFITLGLLSVFGGGGGGPLIGGGIAIIAYGWKCVKGFDQSTDKLINS